MIKNNDKGEVDFDIDFESAIDGFIQRSVGTEKAAYHSTKLGKRKHGDESSHAVNELLFYFYKSLRERKLVDLWMNKEVVRKNQRRLDEINAMLSQHEQTPTTLLRAKHAASGLLKEMSYELLSQLF